LKYLILTVAIGLCLYAVGTAGQKKTEAEADSPVGICRGESLCTTPATACHNENVVYYIEAIADKPDSMFIRADKIVDGKPITMRAGPWEYNRVKHTLSWESKERHWLLSIRGNRIDGTLTESNNVVFRRMTLTRDGQ
jgi:hypothetical protein